MQLTLCTLTIRLLNVNALVALGATRDALEVLSIVEGQGYSKRPPNSSEVMFHTTLKVCPVNTL